MIFDLGISQISSSLDADLLVVMPIYNEAANIRQVLSEWIPYLEKATPRFCIIALNDGSKDNTAEVLAGLEKELGDRLCVVSKINSGHGQTCRMGYEIAGGTKAAWILQIDSDGQCDPKYFPEFWSQREESDCVFGRRMSRDDGTARMITSWICSKGSSLVCGRDMGDANVPYRLLRREVLAKALAHVPKDFNIHNVALTYMLKRYDGLRWSYIPIHFRDRQGGTNSIDLLRVTKWGAEMLFELLSLKRPS